MPDRFAWRKATSACIATFRYICDGICAKQASHRYDKDLFARLRFLRKQIADLENIPPYIVFNDATLQEMAEFLPTSKVEMLEINGVGERKFERFGQAFMSLIKEHQNNRK